MATEEITNNANSRKSITTVFISLLIAFIISVLASSITRFGSISAIKNPTVVFDLMSGALGGIIIFPLVHIAIASMWKAQRNSRSRRNIFFGWGVALSVLQVLILISAPDRLRLEEAALDPPVVNQSVTSPAKHDPVEISDQTIAVESKILDPENTIKTEGYESRSIGDDGITIFYVLGKTETPSNIEALESQIYNLPKNEDTFKACDFMRGGTKASLIEQTGENYDVVTTNHGYDGPVMVCILKYMLEDKVGTQIIFSKSSRDVMHMVFIKS